jgi:hypothetical protein
LEPVYRISGKGPTKLQISPKVEEITPPVTAIYKRRKALDKAKAVAETEATNHGFTAGSKPWNAANIAEACNPAGDRSPPERETRGLSNRTANC